MPEIEPAHWRAAPGCIRIADDADICHQALPAMQTATHLLFPADHLDVGMMQADDCGMVSLALGKGSGGLQLLLTPEGARQLIAGIQRATDKAETLNQSHAAAQLKATLQKGSSHGA